MAPDGSSPTPQPGEEAHTTRAIPLEISPALGRRIEPHALAFQAGMLETLLARGPRPADVLADLAHVYTRQGRIAEGLALDRELVELLPKDPVVRYNLACSLALSGRHDAACDALEEAAELGYAEIEQMLADDDLASLRELPRFRAFVERLRES